MALYETWAHRRRALKLHCVSSSLFKRSRWCISAPLEDHMTAQLPLMTPCFHFVSFLSFLVAIIAWKLLFLPVAYLSPASRSQSRLLYHPVPYLKETQKRRKIWLILSFLILSVSYQLSKGSQPLSHLGDWIGFPPVVNTETRSQGNKFSRMYLWFSYTPDCSCAVRQAKRP